jgi:hypothetical protein
MTQTSTQNLGESVQVVKKQAAEKMEEEIKLTLPEKCHPYKMRLEIDDDISKEDLIEAGKALYQSAKSSPWWLGDWMIYVKGNYVEEEELSDVYALYESYSKGYLRNAMWVCGVFEPSCRHDNLTFSHHQELASIKDEKEREHWLDEAKKHHYSTKKLRKMIAEDKQEKENQKLLEDKSCCVVKNSYGNKKPYRFEDYLALCEKYTNILDTKVMDLIDHSKEYFNGYFKPYDEEILGDIKYFVGICKAVESRLHEVQKLFTEHLTNGTKGKVKKTES